MQSYGRNKVDPLNRETPTLGEVDSGLFGEESSIPSNGRMVAKPTPINNIMPDVTQPRRVIPAAIRAGWSGQLEDMPHLIRSWRAAVEAELGYPLDIKRLLTTPHDDEIEALRGADNAIVAGFMDVLALANSIHRDGLINPITIVYSGGGYLIESGERRWLAHYLLFEYADPRKAVIPAFIKDKLNVWQQAAENAQRAPLNAIGMARQLALLIMEMYRGDDGVSFDSYSDLVYGCDRVFYAQVANGNAWRIKKGFLDRILGATGLKSYSQISRYRALLDIPDHIWDIADTQNWTEGYIREYMDVESAIDSDDTLPIGKVSDAADTPSREETDDTLTVVKVSDAADTPSTIDPDTGEISVHLTAEQRDLLTRAAKYRKTFERHGGWMQVTQFNKRVADELHTLKLVDVMITERTVTQPPHNVIRINDAGYAALGVVEAIRTPGLLEGAHGGDASVIRHQSTQPQAEVWDTSGRVLKALKMLAQVTDDAESKLALMNLMKVSEADVAGYYAKPGGDQEWLDGLNVASGHVSAALNDVTKVLQEFVDHLASMGGGR